MTVDLTKEARKYLSRRAKDRQCDQDIIHAYDAGTEENPEGICLRVSTLSALLARLEAAEAKLARMEEALIWCSGSEDFQDGGYAREGWLKLCAPLIHATLQGEG